MARRPRADEPGSWHHAVNRGIAKRPYFETRSDKRYFLSRIAYEVRAGRLELHAFSLMTSHFHLLVRSPKGELSEAMRRIQSAYSRYFNRRRRRDGPLIRSRFFSKRVTNDLYRRTLVRYIDANAVRAGIVQRAADHEFCSARHYVSGAAPPWLQTDWVTCYAMGGDSAQPLDAESYSAAFGAHRSADIESLSAMVELRMRSPGQVDALEDLVGASPAQVKRWMRRKADLADGMAIGLPVCGPSAAARAIDEHLRKHGEWLYDSKKRVQRGSELSHAGLLRDLCGLTYDQIAKLSELKPWQAQKLIRTHHEALLQDEEYATTVAQLTRAAVAATVGGPGVAVETTAVLEREKSVG